MALGAYTTGILTAKFGWPIFPAMVAALAVTAILAFAIGAVTLRLKPDFFALATFGFGEAIKGVLALATKLTGGATGLFGVPQVVTNSVIWSCVLGSVILVAWLTYTSFGRKSLAIRDDFLVADAMGIAVFAHRMKVFVISSVLVSLCGCLYVHYTSFIDPSMFGWMKSVEWMLLVFVGGRGNLIGTLVSSGILLALPELLRPINAWRTVIYGVLVLTVLNFRPDGIFGNWYAKTTKPTLVRRVLNIFRKERVTGGGSTVT